MGKRRSSPRLSWQFSRDIADGHVRHILTDTAKKAPPEPTCSVTDLQWAVKDKGIVARESYVQFLSGGPVRRVLEILPNFTLRLEGFALAVSPRGVRKVPKPNTTS